MWEHENKMKRMFSDGDKKAFYTSVLRNAEKDKLTIGEVHYAATRLFDLTEGSGASYGMDKATYMLRRLALDYLKHKK
jgi:hypothetical protein